MREEKVIIERYRICAVCKKRHGATYGFKNTLKRLGIEGDKAVPSCVVKAVKAKQQTVRGITGVEIVKKSYD